MRRPEWPVLEASHSLDRLRHRLRDVIPRNSPLESSPWCLRFVLHFGTQEGPRSADTSDLRLFVPGTGFELHSVLVWFAWRILVVVCAALRKGYRTSLERWLAPERRTSLASWHAESGRSSSTP